MSGIEHCFEAILLGNKCNKIGILDLKSLCKSITLPHPGLLHWKDFSLFLIGRGMSVRTG